VRTGTRPVSAVVREQPLRRARSWWRTSCARSTARPA
jgi:hypothetical protein